MKKYRLEFLPYIQRSDIGEIEVSLELFDTEFEKFKAMSIKERKEFIRSNAIVKVTDFDVEYIIEDEEIDICQFEEIN